LCLELKVAAFLASVVSPGQQEWQLLQACIPDLVGLPHRMEFVHKDEHGISWINDSKATNVDAVKVCLLRWFSTHLKGLKDNRPIQKNCGTFPVRHYLNHNQFVTVHTHV
jgi:hypothetical protein